VQTGAELGVGVGVVPPTGYEQKLSERRHRMLGQLGLTQQCRAYLVVTDNVPPMHRMFIAQVRDELGDRHPSARPRDDSLWVPLEHVHDQSPHPSFFGIKAHQKIDMPKSLKWSLALFKTAGLGNGTALEVRFEMAVDLHRDPGDMCGDLVGGQPSQELTASG